MYRSRVNDQHHLIRTALVVGGHNVLRVSLLSEYHKEHFFFLKEEMQSCISLHHIRVMHLSVYIIEGICERIVEHKQNPRSKQDF